MKSTELRTDRTEHEQRLKTAEIQLADARHELGKAQKSFVRGKISADDLTQAQARETALASGVALLQQAIIDLGTEITEAEAEEARQTALAEMVELAKTAQDTEAEVLAAFDEGAAQIEAIGLRIFNAKMTHLDVRTKFNDLYQNSDVGISDVSAAGIDVSAITNNANSQKYPFDSSTSREATTKSEFLVTAHNAFLQHANAYRIEQEDRNKADRRARGLNY